MSVSIGDVTGDHHPDVLTLETVGSGGCGAHTLAASAAGKERTLFANNTCETGLGLAGGALLVDKAIGPCPYPGGSAHCFGGVRHELLRWNGSKLVEHKTRITCALPRLDPSHNCAPKLH
jgi:hypothetical protein